MALAELGPTLAFGSLQCGNDLRPRDPRGQLSKRGLLADCDLDRANLKSQG
jgi:hypothetical protein